MSLLHSGIQPSFLAKRKIGGIPVGSRTGASSPRRVRRLAISADLVPRAARHDAKDLNAAPQTPPGSLPFASLFRAILAPESEAVRTRIERVEPVPLAVRRVTQVDPVA